MKPKVKIHGFGYVGMKTYEMLKNHCEVSIYDKHKTLSIANIASTTYDFEFICVPTPADEATGACDTFEVEEAVKSTTENAIVIIKSTVAVGTCEKLKQKHKRKIVFNPEYVGQSTYDNSFSFHTNMAKTPMVVIGGDNEDLEQAYNLYLPVVGAEKRFYFLTCTEAELVKYMENTFFALKVTYANQMYDVAKLFGCDWKRLREAWVADPRLSPMHTAVFSNHRGYDGKCFPKDTRALLHACEQKGFTPKLLKTVVELNNEYRACK